MKTAQWGRPSACDGLSITYGGFSTVCGSSKARFSEREQAGVDAGRRTGVLPHAACLNGKTALSENLTKRPLLRNFLHPLNCEEPTLVTVIRLAMDERHRSGW